MYDQLTVNNNIRYWHTYGGGQTNKGDVGAVRCLSLALKGAKKHGEGIAHSVAPGQHQEDGGKHQHGGAGVAVEVPQEENSHNHDRRPDTCIHVHVGETSSLHATGYRGADIRFKKMTFKNTGMCAVPQTFHDHSKIASSTSQYHSNDEHVNIRALWPASYPEEKPRTCRSHRREMKASGQPEHGGARDEQHDKWARPLAPVAVENDER